MTQGWVTLERALELDPNFKPGWSLDSETGRWHHPMFGFAEQRVQLKPDGLPAFDRVIVSEQREDAVGDNTINAVVWGYDADGNVRIAVTIQARPFVDNPDGTPANRSYIFAQPCVMGFTPEGIGAAGAFREAQEEAGAGDAFIGEPEDLGYIDPNASLCVSWTKCWALQVDLTKVTGQTDRKEGIYKAPYILLRDVTERIAAGSYEDPELGRVEYSSAMPNSVLQRWLYRHPEMLG